MKNKNCLTFMLLLFISIMGFSQNPKAREGNPDNLPVHEYTLTIREEMVNKAGKLVEGMTVNGTIPGPILEFTEGDAVIY